MTGPFGSDLYAELEPLAYDDANQNHALLNYLDTIGNMFDEIETYARDGSLGEPGWSILLDITRVPEKALPWLGQFVGVTPTEGLTAAQKKDQLQAHVGFGRGTPLAVVRAAQPHLSGSKTVVLRERDTSPYHFSVFTYALETPTDPVVGSPALILSGNEITDATRAAGIQGDGRLNDSSYGIWYQTTNLITNGGFETNLTNWIASSGTTLTRVTDTALFGVASAQAVTTIAGGSNTGIQYNPPGSYIAVTPSTTVTFSFYAKARPGSGGVKLNAQINEYNSVPTLLSYDVGADVALSETVWQRVFITKTLSASTTQIQLYITLGETQAAVNSTWVVDGVQLEQSGFATPYVHTDGATVTRPAGRIQAPSTLLNTTQGWWAMRVRMGAPSTWAGYFANWFKVTGTTATNSITLRHSGGGIFEVRRRDNAAVGNAVNSSVVAFNPGDYLTIIGTWTGSQVGVSVNGSAFTYAANNNIPTAPMLANYEIGGVGVAGVEFAGDVLWFLSGSGTLTNADAAAIHALGNQDPAWNSIPQPPQQLWPAATAAYSMSSGSNATILAALLAAKPAGLQMSYSIVSGGSYGGLLAGNATYQTVFTTFTTYRGVLNNAPGT